MVQCAIACCTSSDREKGKDYHVNLFRVPSLPKPAACRGKDRVHREKKSNIKKCQHEAWMSAINRGYEDNAPKPTENAVCRICTHHFHPSVIQCDDNGSYRLKNGAAPTLNLSKFSMVNECYNEKSIAKNSWHTRGFTICA